jgi:hypothetical protein
LQGKAALHPIILYKKVPEIPRFEFLNDRIYAERSWNREAADYADFLYAPLLRAAPRCAQTKIDHLQYLADKR